MQQPKQRDRFSPAIMLERAPVVRAVRRDLVTTLLGPLGLAFLLVGGADLALTWYPTRFGSLDWELGTIMQTLNGLPVYALGLVLLAAWGVARGRRWAVVGVSVGLILSALAIVAMALLLALSVPVALHAVRDPAVLLGLKKAAVKAAVQAVAFPTMFLWVAARTLKRAAPSVDSPEVA